MNEAMLEFALRGAVFLAFFLTGAFLLFRHVEKVKQKYGLPEDGANYMRVIYHFFFRHDDESDDQK